MFTETDYLRIHNEEEKAAIKDIKEMVIQNLNNSVLDKVIEVTGYGKLSKLFSDFRPFDTISLDILPIIMESLHTKDDPTPEDLYEENIPDSALSRGLQIPPDIQEGYCHHFILSATAYLWIAVSRLEESWKCILEDKTMPKEYHPMPTIPEQAASVVNRY